MDYQTILEEARRIQKEMARLVMEDKKQIRRPEHAAEILAAYAAEPQEVFGFIVLNCQNRVLAIHEAHRGGVDQAALDMKVIFKKVLAEPGASRVIFFHNHPSGSPNPSGADKVVTKKLAAACYVLDLELLDHIVVAAGGYYSMHDAGDIQRPGFEDAIKQIYK